MHRRNMWGTTHAVRANACDAEGRRRRRPPYRAATTASDAEAIVQFAAHLYCRELPAGRNNKHVVRDHLQQRLGNFAMVAYNVDHIEATINPTYSLSQYIYEDDYDMLPRSPTTPDTAEFGSPMRIRRLDGAKRCSRCGVLKIAGSGHGRSKCADGLSISSHVPYPASPNHAQF
ncbi:hypothetical protein FGB62_376g07 [Gracilaria domingensis]|nr:hypothetical protein FGB62_376g07 [Gracilaria domingensis]